MKISSRKLAGRIALLPAIFFGEEAQQVRRQEIGEVDQSVSARVIRPESAGSDMEATSQIRTSGPRCKEPAHHYF